MTEQAGHAPPIQRRSTRVVIVGAGFSGLAAGRQLQRYGVDTLIVEARDRVGGRAHSVALDDGTTVDLGGQWIGKNHDRLLAIARQAGVTLQPQHDRGATLLRTSRRHVRVGGTLPLRLGPASLASVGVALLRLDRLAARVHVDLPWGTPDADRLDGRTLEHWIARQIATEEARQVCRSLLTGIFAAEPAEVSLLHALTYLRAGGGLMELTATTGGAQDSWVEGGMSTLAHHLAAGLDTAPIMDEPVQRIDHTTDGVTVLAERCEIAAERVIVALPPTLAGRITYRPGLPAARDHLTQRVPQGAAVKCLAIYDRPFWRDDGLSGLVLDTEGPLAMIIDGSPPQGDRGLLIGFFEGRHARWASALTTDERRTAVLTALSRHFGARARTPRDYRDRDWSAEPYTRGCYAGVLPPGVWTALGPALRAPVGRIHWAGTETATRCMGYIEGALQAGERAASEVMATLGDSGGDHASHTGGTP